MISSVISSKLHQAFSPIYLEVINESNNHNVPKDSQTHFKVIIVSDFFSNKKLLARHRAVNTTLAIELANNIHALAIHTYTSNEWIDIQQAPQSPKCMSVNKFIE